MVRFSDDGVAAGNVQVGWSNPPRRGFTMAKHEHLEAAKHHTEAAKPHTEAAEHHTKAAHLHDAGNFTTRATTTKPTPTPSTRTPHRPPRMANLPKRMANRLSTKNKSQFKLRKEAAAIQRPLSVCVDGACDADMVKSCTLRIRVVGRDSSLLWARGHG